MADYEFSGMEDRGRKKKMSLGFWCVVLAKTFYDKQQQQNRFHQTSSSSFLFFNSNSNLNLNLNVVTLAC